MSIDRFVISVRSKKSSRVIKFFSLKKLDFRSVVSIREATAGVTRLETAIVSDFYLVFELIYYLNHDFGSVIILRQFK